MMLTNNSNAWNSWISNNEGNEREDTPTWIIMIALALIAICAICAFICLPYHCSENLDFGDASIPTSVEMEIDVADVESGRRRTSTKEFLGSSSSLSNWWNGTGGSDSGWIVRRKSIPALGKEPEPRKSSSTTESEEIKSIALDESTSQ